MSLRQQEHTAKGLEGILDPAAVLDALRRRADDPSVDIYDVPLLKSTPVSSEMKPKRRRASSGLCASVDPIPLACVVSIHV